MAQLSPDAGPADGEVMSEDPGDEEVGEASSVLACTQHVNVGTARSYGTYAPGASSRAYLCSRQYPGDYSCYRTGTPRRISGGWRWSCLKNVCCCSELARARCARPMSREPYERRWPPPRGQRLSFLTVGSLPRHLRIARFCALNFCALKACAGCSAADS